MFLTENQGKTLLKEAGLAIPRSLSVNSKQLPLKKVPFSFPAYVKAQVLHGNRANQQLVVKADNQQNLDQKLSDMFEKKDQYGQPITEVLIETAETTTALYYLALRYDTHTRNLVALYSKEAGTGMDDRGDSLQIVTLSIDKAPTSFKPNSDLIPTVQKLWQVFTKNDATLVEINPLAKTDDGFVCLDAKIELEDIAQYRHPEWDRYGEQSPLGRPLTDRERKAHQVSAMDHRGVAGESFFEFEGGTIGVMASGGGASTLAMDALLAENLKPANYTEYSGNPTREKVAALANVVLSIDNLEALYVVGSNANFTDIYETLAGVIDGLLDSSYAQQEDFVLLVRRGGPRWEEGFEMVKERLKDTPIIYELCGPTYPLVATAARLKELLSKA